MATTTVLSSVAHPALFANISYYTECFQNASLDDKDSFDNRASAISHVHHKYYGWLALPLTLIAFAFTVLFSFAVLNAIRFRRVSRKYYVLLLNRAIGDMLCCISSLATSAYVFSVENPSKDWVAFFETFFISCFWSAMVSYVAISCIKLYAVWRPFHFRKTITMKRCIHLAILSWVIFALMATYSLTVTAFTKVPFLNEWSGCRAETCLRLMYRTRNLFAAIVYFITLAVFALTLVFINRSRKFTDSFRHGDTQGEARRSARFPFWKLALNVATFGGFNLLYVAFALFMLLQDQCFFQRHFVELYHVLAYIRCTLLLRILADCVISFITDFQLRRSLLACLGLEGKLAVSSRNGLFRHTTQSDDASSYERSEAGISKKGTVVTIA